MDKITGTILSAGTNLIGQGITNQQNKQLAEYQYKKNLEMWNLQNKYNEPSAQMSRLRAAGLNPNLLYGTGVEASAQAPKYEKPEYNLDTQVDPLSMAAIAAQIEKTKAETDNTKSATVNNKLNATNQMAQAAIQQKIFNKMGLDISFQEMVNNMKEFELANQLGTYSAGINKQIAETEATRAQEARTRAETPVKVSNIKADTDLKEASKEATEAGTSLTKQKTKSEIINQRLALQDEIYNSFRNDLSKLGITTSDSWQVRTIAKTMSQEGLDTKEIMRETRDFLQYLGGDKTKMPSSIEELNRIIHNWLN